MELVGRRVGRVRIEEIIGRDGSRARFRREEEAATLARFQRALGGR
jgi:hypothetical protein